MRLLKQAMAVMGTVTMIALLMAVVAPHSTHALVAALVQIVPGATTHVGQNESQLVSLECAGENCSFAVVDPEAATSGTAYVVPSGHTLIVTDYEWTSSVAASFAGVQVQDFFYNTATGSGFVVSKAVVASDGGAYGHEHYSTGIRVGSGVTLGDVNLSGLAFIQGYLVPND